MTLGRCLHTASLYWLALVLAFCASTAHAQLSNVDASKIQVDFREREIEFFNSEIVSNPMKVVNRSATTVSFTLEASLPPGWSSLSRSTRIYTLAAGDSTFIPFRVIPKGSLIGNTKYAINVMLRTDDGLPVGVTSFFCFTKKIVKWEMSMLPESKVYFKNDEDIGRFGISILNTGNYKQDFQLSLNGGQREDMLLLDTNNNIVRNPSYTLPLDGGSDTSLYFKVKPAQFKRNSRTVSLISHRPLSELEEQRFRFYAVSEEAKQVGHNHTKKGAKVDFIKLANEKTVSPYRSDHLPLIAEAQIQNILSDYSFMSLNLRGIKQIDRQSRLMYFTQLYYSESYFNSDQFKNLPWYIGYFRKKWDIQVGQINGRAMGVLSSGKGITGSYLVHKHHRIGAHFAQSPGLLSNAQINSYGVYHDYTGPGRIRVSSTLARSENQRLGITSNVASSRMNMRIASGHNISLFGAFSLREYTDSTLRQTGYMTGATYSGSMIDRRLRITLNGRYAQPTFGTSTSERYSATNRTSFQVNHRTQLQLLNNVNHINRYIGADTDSLQYKFQTVFNRLNASVKTHMGVFQPGLFYDITAQSLFTNHYRGFSLTYSNFNFQHNTLYTTTLRMGYNNPLEYPEIKEYFTASASLLARVKTITVNLRYQYGPSNPLILLNAVTGSTYPQQFRASFQHQYMFKNTHFILQSGMNYSFVNQVNGHSVSIFPELYYFTSNGWRFSVNCNYAFTSSNFQKATSNLNTTRRLEETDPSATISNTVRVGATIRKEFGVPVPFSKQKAYDLVFVTFYDLDGDGIKGKDEPSIENVVIAMENEEVLTNVHGRASLKNMPKGVYLFGIVPLDAPSGWFAETPDSIMVNQSRTIYIPFVRGIKVMGRVVMDREKVVEGMDEAIDLSNIKITATGTGKAHHTLTGFDGSFELFLPNGSYTMTVDENILTDRFRMMQNDLLVTLDKDMENIFVTFFIIEKRRKVNVKRFGPK